MAIRYSAEATPTWIPRAEKLALPSTWHLVWEPALDGVVEPVLRQPARARDRGGHGVDLAFGFEDGVQVAGDPARLKARAIAAPPTRKIPRLDAALGQPGAEFGEQRARTWAASSSAESSRRSVRGALASLADPDLRLGVGLAGLALSGLAVHARSIGRREATLFRAVNGLPDGLFVPAWVLMQSGTLAAGPVAGAIAWTSGRPRLGLRLALGGVAS